MKTGDRITIQGEELVAVPYRGDHHIVCTGCVLQGTPDCINPRCKDHILVTLPEAIAIKLTGETR